MGECGSGAARTGKPGRLGKQLPGRTAQGPDEPPGLVLGNHPRLYIQSGGRSMTLKLPRCVSNKQGRAHDGY